MCQITYKVEEITNYFESGETKKIIGYATGNPMDIAEFFMARSQQRIEVTPLEVIVITPDIAQDIRQAKQQLQEAKDKLQKIIYPGK